MTAPPAPDLVLVSGSSSVRTPAALNHAVYAARHDLRYVYDATPAAVSLIYLHKVRTIRRHLQTADWLFWLDDDAFFTRLGQDVRSFVPEEPGVDLVFCASPVNPEGGWTWMSSGQLLVRNSPEMLGLLDAVEATDLAAVRRWWQPDRYGLFTAGDQDAFVYQLARDDSPWAGRFSRLDWPAFNARPYHYRRELDEQFICHFAVPGGRSKLELVDDFARRMGTTRALVSHDELRPYATFVTRSELAGVLAPGDIAAVATATPRPRRPRSLPRRVAGRARRALGRLIRAGRGA